MPVATAIAQPPLDPPGIRVGSCGLRACGLVTPSANSCVRRLAEDHGAGGAPEVDAVGVDLGDGVVGVRAAAGADAADVDDVLDGDRDAVQRAAAPAGAQLGVADARLGQRGLGVDLDERGPLVAGDPRQRLLGQLDAGGRRRRRAPRGGGDRAGASAARRARAAARRGGPKTS